jgi:hypothetical protein
MRLIGVNVLVLLGILYLLNTLSAVALDARYQLEDLVNGEDESAALAFLGQPGRPAHEEAWQELRATLPDIGTFRKHFGHVRRHG